MIPVTSSMFSSLVTILMPSGGLLLSSLISRMRRRMTAGGIDWTREVNRVNSRQELCQVQFCTHHCHVCRRREWDEDVVNGELLELAVWLDICLSTCKQAITKKRPQPSLLGNQHPYLFLRPDMSSLSPESSSFTQLVESGKLVDKSHALRKFLREGSPVHALLCPHGSGKTTLLGMFQ
jgi:hypothetical protein